LTHRHTMQRCSSTISLSISTVIKTVHFVSCHTRQRQQQQPKQQPRRQLQILHINKSKARQGKAKQSPTIRLSSCQWHTLSRYNYAPDSQSFNQLQRPMPNLGYDFHSTNVQQRQCAQLYKRLVADYDFVLSMAWLKLQSPPYRLPISQICQTPQLPAYLMDT